MAKKNIRIKTLLILLILFAILVIPIFIQPQITGFLTFETKTLDDIDLYENKVDILNTEIEELRKEIYHLENKLVVLNNYCLELENVLEEEVYVYDSDGNLKTTTLSNIRVRYASESIR